jgi:hypothetical protein
VQYVVFIKVSYSLFCQGLPLGLCHVFAPHFLEEENSVSDPLTRTSKHKNNGFYCERKMTTPPEILVEVYKKINESMVELLNEQKTTIDELRKELQDIKDDYHKLKVEYASVVEHLCKG